MSQLNAMFQAVEFVEAHLNQPITVADMAEAAACSLYHFCRTFNKVVHHTPYDYLMRRRLSEAAQILATTERKIIDVALDYQFNSPETFARAFRRMFGQQPNLWRKQGQPDRHSLMLPLTLAHLQHLNQDDYLRPVLIQKEMIRLAGLMTLVKPESDPIPELWTRLGQVLAEFEPLPAPDYFGLAWYPPNWSQRGFFYLAAIELAGSPDLAGSPLVLKTIPPSTYARFIHKGPRQTLPLTLDYVYQTWLPHSGRKLIQPLELEVYGQEGGGVDRPDAERAILFPVD